MDGSFLLVPEGATLALSAGEVALDAAFVATLPLPVGPGDTALAVAAQRGAGEVPVSADGPAVARDGSVRIGASGQGIPAQLIMSAPDGGRIKIEGGDVVIDGANLFSVSTGAADAIGGIDIAAQTLTLQQRSFDVGAGAQPFGNLVTSSAGTGAAGPLRLSVTDSIDLNGSIVASSPIGVGGAGPVTVTTDRLSMNFGAIGTPTGLQSGGVPVRGSSNATIVKARSSILLTEGAQILSSSFGDAEAGPLTVSTQGTITISNGARISRPFGGAQQQRPDVGGDRATVERGHHRTPFHACKLHPVQATLCRHRGAPPLEPKALLQKNFRSIRAPMHLLPVRYPG